MSIYLKVRDQAKNQTVFVLCDGATTIAEVQRRYEGMTGVASDCKLRGAAGGALEATATVAGSGLESGSMVYV